MQAIKRENYCPAQTKGLSTIKMNSLACYYQTYSSGPYILGVNIDVLVTFCGIFVVIIVVVCLFIATRQKLGSSGKSQPHLREFLYGLKVSLSGIFLINV